MIEAIVAIVIGILLICGGAFIDYNTGLGGRRSDHQDMSGPIIVIGLIVTGCGIIYALFALSAS